MFGLRSLKVRADFAWQCICQSSMFRDITDLNSPQTDWTASEMFIVLRCAESPTDACAVFLNLKKTVFSIYIYIYMNHYIILYPSLLDSSCIYHYIIKDLRKSDHKTHPKSRFAKSRSTCIAMAMDDAEDRGHLYGYGDPSAKRSKLQDGES